MRHLICAAATLLILVWGTTTSAQKVETLTNESIEKSKDLAPITINEHFQSLPEPVGDIGLTFSEGREPRSALGKEQKSLKTGGGGFRIIDVKGPIAPAVSTQRIMKNGPSRNRHNTIRVVEFWATWCGPCKQTIPALSQMQKQFQNRNVQIIGITSEEDVSVVQQYVDDMGASMNYTVGFDPDWRTTGAFSRIWKVNSIPHAYLVSHDNRIVWHGHPGNAKLLEAAIQEAIQYRDSSR